MNRWVSAFVNGGSGLLLAVVTVLFLLSLVLSFAARGETELSPSFVSGGKAYFSLGGVLLLFAVGGVANLLRDYLVERGTNVDLSKIARYTPGSCKSIVMDPRAASFVNGGGIVLVSSAVLLLAASILLRGGVDFTLGAALVIFFIGGLAGLVRHALTREKRDAEPGRTPHRL